MVPIRLRAEVLQWLWELRLWCAASSTLPPYAQALTAKIAEAMPCATCRVVVVMRHGVVETYPIARHRIVRAEDLGGGQA